MAPLALPTHGGAQHPRSTECGHRGHVLQRSAVATWTSKEKRKRKDKKSEHKQTDDVRVGCGYCVPKVQRGETFDDDVC